MNDHGTWHNGAMFRLAISLLALLMTTAACGGLSPAVPAEVEIDWPDAAVPSAPPQATPEQKTAPAASGAPATAPRSGLSALL